MATASSLPWSSSESSKSDSVSVEIDKKYGCKQVISVTPQLHDYILDNVTKVKDPLIFIALCPLSP